MSLLMDALKKAEQEKKEAAKRQENETVQGPGESNETDPSEIEASAEKPSGNIDNGKKPDELTLEPVNEISVENDESLITDDLTNNNNKLPRTQIEGSKEIPESPDLSEIEALDLEEQVADNALSKEADMDVLNKNSREETTSDHFYTTADNKTARTFVSAEQLIRDIGGGRDQPTPVSASTVFSAKGYVPDNQVIKWVVFVFFCLVVTVSFTVFYYFNVLPSVPEFTSSVISRGTVIKADPPQLTVLAEEFSTVPKVVDSGSDPIAENQQVNNDNELSVVKETDHEIAEAMVSPEILPEPTEITMAHDDINSDENQIIVMEAKENEMEMTNDDELQSVPDDTAQGFSDPVDIGVEKINISKSKSVNVHASIIKKAYMEYQAGNYTLAESGYRQVLEKYPENLDALLGIAAIKHRNGEIQSAYLNYLEVLKFYPGNAFAQSALIGLNQNIDPVKGESAVNLLLQKQPETAHLYFTLGNLYAGQEKWMRAQRAFFEAFRIDSKNPDYALNLAISLDRIGQPKSALNYYNEALSLASKFPVGFDKASVIARINNISDNLQLD